MNNQKNLPYVKILVVILVVVCIGIGIYFLIKSNTSHFTNLNLPTPKIPIPIIYIAPKPKYKFYGNVKFIEKTNIVRLQQYNFKDLTNQINKILSTDFSFDKKYYAINTKGVISLLEHLPNLQDIAYIIVIG